MTDQEKQLYQDFKDCFKTPPGKRVLDYLSGVCFEHRNTFARWPEIQNFNNGKREIILLIRHFIEKDLDKPESEKEKTYDPIYHDMETNL